jgi:hypothetical protein
MSVINYSLSGDFSGNIREDQFHTEVLSNSEITASFDGIVKNGDLISVKFFGNITTQEGNVLHNIVASHVPDFTPIRRINIILPTTTNYITSNNWTRIGVGKYPGTNITGNITYIDVYSYMGNGLVSYDVKVIDRANVDVLCSGNFNNTSLNYNSLGTINYQPQEQTTLECLAKVNGTNGEKLNIQNIDIWYGE